MAVVEIEHLSYTYPDGRQALSDISLDIEAGDKIAVAGPNGAGKSTLLLHLNGLLAGEGKITVNDLEMKPANYPAIRAAVGFVFQNPDDQLFSPTVNEDVAYGPLYLGMKKEEILQCVQDALNLVGMGSFGNRVSHHLSTGEKKRIALATVLSMKPELLVLDEPTAGLDPRARKNLIQLLMEMPQTMVIATHDLSMARQLCTRMVILENGRLTRDERTPELMADRAFLEEHGLNLPD